MKDNIVNYINDLDIKNEEKEQLLQFANELMMKRNKLFTNIDALKNNNDFSKSIIDIIKELTRERDNVKRNA